MRRVAGAGVSYPLSPMAATSPTDVEAAAARLEREAPGYLERVRRATMRLAARPGTLGDPRIALDALGEVTTVNVDVPTASRRRPVRVIKVVIRRLLGWYLRYLGDQVTVLGQAVARLGAALVERTEQLGDETAKLQRDVNGLAERVERLERGQR
jgi:hypothetical protein